MTEQFVIDVTMVVDNTESASVAVNEAVSEALAALPTDASEYDRLNAAGEAVQDVVYEIVRDECDEETFTGLLIGQFLGIGTDGWREVGRTYLP
ncbi:MAG: hypothetical protein ABIQ39_02610 [Ilumatobacteraceae bacterium]